MVRGSSHSKKVIIGTEGFSWKVSLVEERYKIVSNGNLALYILHRRVWANRRFLISECAKAQLAVNDEMSCNGELGLRAVKYNKQTVGPNSPMKLYLYSFRYYFLCLSINNENTFITIIQLPNQFTIFIPDGSFTATIEIIAMANAV